jgi:undecaprenyl diphosphate synthase
MNNLPHHVVIVMDGNGRWASQRSLPRHAGHKKGVEATRQIIQQCAKKGIAALTLFAFSSENWRRPKTEVSLLMELFITSLRREIKSLHKSQVRLRFIGDVSAFPDKLQKQIAESELLTSQNSGLNLNIAANYGGRWDIAAAARQLAEKVQAGEIAPADISPELFSSFVSLSELPEPDLFIRTGGEQRISNFLLWQLAYTELYFAECLWPDFDEVAFEQALEVFEGRQRRFGRTGEQLEQQIKNA